MGLNLGIIFDELVGFYYIILNGVLCFFILFCELCFIFKLGVLIFLFSDLDFVVL